MSENAEKNFIDLFCQIFEMYSYGNVHYGRLCAHILLGQKLRHIKMYFGPFYTDPRISLFLVQPSGTGKSVPWGFIKEVGSKAGLMLDDIDEATDAALIGHVDAEEIRDEETKTKTTVYNTVTGKLANADILHYDEGQMLVRRGPYAANTLAWLQKALNPIGSGQNLCSKYLAHGKIEFYPSCSLLITSHEILNLLDVVMDTGFFQRIVLYPRFVTINERKDNEFLRADRFAKRIFTEIDGEALADKLKQIGEKYKNYEVSVDDKIYPIIKANIDQIYKYIGGAHERVRDVMATFVPRYNNLLYTFSLHHMCAELKDKIDVEDVKYGILITNHLFREVMMWVEENISLNKLNSKDQAYLNSAYLIYKSMTKDPDGYVMKVSFIKQCSQKWRVSIQSVLRNIDKFRGFNKVKEIEKESTKYIKIEI